MAVAISSSTMFTGTVKVDQSPLLLPPMREILTPTGGPTDSSVQLVLEIGRTGLDAYATITGVQAIGGAPFELVEIDWQLVQRPVGTLARV